MRLRILVLAAVLALVACGNGPSDVRPSPSATGGSPVVQSAVPWRASVTIPVQYVGRWSTHAAYLEIGADGSGVAWAHWGPCTNSISETRMCALVATLALVPTSGGLDATVKAASINLEDETPSGTPMADIAVPAGFPRQGDTFTLTLSGDKLRQDVSNFWPSMPSVWCDAKLMTASGDCGA